MTANYARNISTMVSHSHLQVLQSSTLYLQMVMNNAQTVLENADVPDLLIAVMELIQQINKYYPHAFNNHFRVCSTHFTNHTGIRLASTYTCIQMVCVNYSQNRHVRVGSLCALSGWRVTQQIWFRTCMTCLKLHYLMIYRI